MKEVTLGTELRALRRERGLRLTNIAEATGLSLRPVWNAENGTGVKWETMHLILAVGMKIRPGSHDYETVHRLWLEDRQRRAVTKAEGKHKKQASPHEIAAVLAFRRIIKGMAKEDIKALMVKVRRAAKSARAPQ
jgi:transcriptional regulator with XRE-family HTH domain